MKRDILPKYGFLEVIKRVDNTVYMTNGGRRSEITLLCKCKCGTIGKYALTKLHTGNTKSCGCLQKELMHIEKATHHLSKTSEYGIWIAMRDRCSNPKNKAYRLYGNKGIKVCERWLNSFENFIADMGERPTLNHSIDRFPDKNGNYEPNNCRWATQKQQTRNLNTNVIIDFKGEKRVLIEVCEELNISTAMVRHRIKKGWSVDFALFAPKNSNYKSLLKSIFS